MKLTQFTDFSLRMLLYLGTHRDRLVTIGEVAEFYGISEEHLKKVSRHLAVGGYLTTVRGRCGGVTLAREPSEINVAALVRGCENLDLLPCGEDDGCPVRGTCKLKTIVKGGLDAFLAHLGAYTLADLL